MKDLTLLTTVFATILFAQNTLAVSIYECVDEDGNSTFQDRCPPGTTPKSEKKYSTGLPDTGSEAATPVSVVLYFIPECAGCEQVRQFFADRNVSLVEKNVQDNVELQDELKSKVGSLSVPTVDINGEYVSGYNEDALNKIMDGLNPG